MSEDDFTEKAVDLVTRIARQKMALAIIDAERDNAHEHLQSLRADLEILSAKQVSR